MSVRVLVTAYGTCALLCVVCYRAWAHRRDAGLRACEASARHEGAGTLLTNTWRWISENSRTRKRYDLLLTLDIGSSSIRCTAFRLHSESQRTSRLTVMATHKEKLAVVTDGRATDAETIVAKMESCIDGCLSQLRAVGRFSFSARPQLNVVAVGFASFVMNLVAVDRAGNFVSQIFTYARRDKATAQVATALRASLLQSNALEDSYKRTGTPVHSSYATVQLKEYYESSACSDIMWQTIASSAIGKWTGHARNRISVSEAAWTGLLDFHQMKWDEEMLGYCGIPLEHLPELADPRETCQCLSGEYAKRWPELKQTPFHFGIGDGAAANIGSRCTQPGLIAVTIGTSAAARVVIPLGNTVNVPEGLWCYCVDSTMLLIGGALTDGGSVIEWFTKTFSVSSTEFKQLELEVRQAIESGAPAKVRTLVFFSGERSTGFRDDATASMHGLTRGTNRVDILRSLFEGVCMRLRAVIEQIEKLGPAYGKEAVIVASGAALESSELWRWILAQVTGRKVVTLRVGGELTSVGVAEMLMGYLGMLEDVWDPSLVSSEKEPTDTLVKMYDAAYKAHLSLYSRTNS